MAMIALSGGAQVGMVSPFRTWSCYSWGCCDAVQQKGRAASTCWVMRASIMLHFNARLALRPEYQRKAALLACSDLGSHGCCGLLCMQT